MQALSESESLCAGLDFDINIPSPTSKLPTPTPTPSAKPTANFAAALDIDSSKCCKASLTATRELERHDGAPVNATSIPVTLLSHSFVP